MHLACFVNILILRNDMVTLTRISNKRYDFQHCIRRCYLCFLISGIKELGVTQPELLVTVIYYSVITTVYIRHQP